MTDEEFHKILNVFAWAVRDIRNGKDLKSIHEAVTRFIEARIISEKLFNENRGLMNMGLWCPGMKN